MTAATSSIATKVYVRAVDFPSAPFDAALARFRADPGWTTIDMKCGHDVMIDQPAELVAILERLG